MRRACTVAVWRHGLLKLQGSISNAQWLLLLLLLLLLLINRGCVKAGPDAEVVQNVFLTC